MQLQLLLNMIFPFQGKSGDKAIILNDGSLLGWIGGGCTNPIVIEEGLSALNSGKSKLIVIDPENNSDMVLVKNIFK